MLSLHDLIRWNLSQIVAFCERLGPSRATIHGCAQVAFDDVLSGGVPLQTRLMHIKKQKRKKRKFAVSVASRSCKQGDFFGFHGAAFIDNKKSQAPVLFRRPVAVAQDGCLAQMHLHSTNVSSRD